ncbi:hypothetical protein HMPREF1138_0683 [Actinomyces sp. ICM58]|nr:hypothetical protein HMPREF1138_0683 [Actinomyces sp. ICM58]
MKRDKRRVFLFGPLLSGPNAAATRRPLGVLGLLGVLAGAR